MNILFLHQNYPGQYKHLLPYCASRGHRVIAMGNRDPKQFPKSFPYQHYAYDRSTSQGIDSYAIDFESKMIRARSCAKKAISMRDRANVYPDVICAHTGWGEELFLKDVWPDAKVIGYCEYFYNSKGYDLGFDDDALPPDPHADWRTHSKNASIFLSLEQMDCGVTPTYFQRNTYPPSRRNLIRVIHDGIDTVTLKRKPDAQFDHSHSSFTCDDEVLTFVSRSLEPTRGFHTFMRAIPLLQQLRPNLNIFIVGESGSGYGRAPEIPFKDQLLKELSDDLDLDRIYFTGRLPYPKFVNLLSISSCHLYLTAPFVLSWSMLESMSLGCLLLASSTDPVKEVIDDGVNGFLVDFFDSEAMARRAAELLENRHDYQHIRDAARQTVVDRYERNTCLQQHHALIQAAHHGLI